MECASRETFFQSNLVKEGLQIKYGNGGIWPKGRIKYYIDPKVKSKPVLFKKVLAAIKEWNVKNHPHCVFLETKTKDCVRFLSDDTMLPHSKVGYW